MKGNEKDILKQISDNFVELSEQDIIRINETYDDLTLFFLNGGKGVWDNCAKIICYNSNERLEKYLPNMLEWLKDINWPGAELIFDKLKTFDYCVIKPYLEQAIFEASNTQDIRWLDELKYLSESLNHFELSKIIDERIIKIHLDTKKERINHIMDCIKNLNNNISVLESLLILGNFIDPIFIPYFERYKNNQNDLIRKEAEYVLDRMNKIIGDPTIFTENSNKEFWKYMQKSSDYDLEKIKEDILNPKLKLCALRMLNLYLEKSPLSKSFLPYFEPFVNDIDDEIRGIANIALKILN